MILLVQSTSDNISGSGRVQFLCKNSYKMAVEEGCLFINTIGFQKKVV